jgi:hypothetical protein
MSRADYKLCGSRSWWNATMKEWGDQLGRGMPRARTPRGYSAACDALYLGGTTQRYEFCWHERCRKHPNHYPPFAPEPDRPAQREGAGA